MAVPRAGDFHLGTPINGDPNPTHFASPIDATTTHPPNMATDVNDSASEYSGSQPNATGRPAIMQSTSMNNGESSSSSGHTLAEGQDSPKASAPENTLASKRSANSSLDHVAELGGPGHVSVRRGKQEFASLERHFSNLSQRSQELQRQNTRRSTRSGTGFVPAEKVVSTTSAACDVEKGEKEDDDFDLAEVIRSGRTKNDQAGIKHKAVGVMWEDLEVVGAGGLKINIRNFSSAIMEQFMMPVISLLGLVGYKPFAPKPRTILHQTSGHLRPGEMCLVIGRPGSGCSTFLKSIANQRDSFLHVNGNVEYAGVGWKEMSKLYGG